MMAAHRTESRNFYWIVLGSLIIHVLLLTAKIIVSHTETTPIDSLEVILLPDATKEDPPLEAKLAANSNQSGEIIHETFSPLMSFARQAAVENDDSQNSHAAATSETTLHPDQSWESAINSSAIPQTADATPSTPAPQEILANQDATFINTPATKQSLEAAYIKKWITHVEQWANQTETFIRKSASSGRLQLLVTLFADGKIKSVHILQSSGDQQLDEQAVAIVYQAAPYPPFSETMKTTMQEIDIIRTWEFNISGIN